MLRLARDQPGAPRQQHRDADAASRPLDAAGATDRPEAPQLQPRAAGAGRRTAGLPRALAGHRSRLRRPRVARINASSIRGAGTSGDARVGITDPVDVRDDPDRVGRRRTDARGDLVFNRADRHSAFDEADSDFIAAYEDELLASADHVLYVSHALMDEEHAIVGERAVFLDHGVDLEHFRATRRRRAGRPRCDPAPAHRLLRRPRRQTVDFALLEHVAQRAPRRAARARRQRDRSDGRARRAARTCTGSGCEPYEEIPRYGAGFDVAIMPWLHNEWIERATRSSSRSTSRSGCRS